MYCTPCVSLCLQACECEFHVWIDHFRNWRPDVGYRANQRSLMCLFVCASMWMHDCICICACICLHLCTIHTCACIQVSTLYEYVHVCSCLCNISQVGICLICHEGIYKYPKETCLMTYSCSWNFNLWIIVWGLKIGVGGDFVKHFCQYGVNMLSTSHSDSQVFGLFWG
jgi:hypothetical protein